MPKPQQSSTTKIKIVSFLILFPVGLFVVYVGWQKLFSSSVISPLPDNPPQKISSFFFRKKDPRELERRIIKSIGDTLKNYSILVRDDSSDFSMAISDSEIFTAASVNKLPILAAVYYLAQKGDINLDQVVTLQEEDIQDYGTGSIRYDPPGTTYSVKTLAKLMMKESDNTAAFLLAHYVVGFDKVQELIDSWGLTQTDMVNNKTSNKDMAILLLKMLRGQVANKGLTQEMLGFLTDSKTEDRIPALLPKGVTVYHKTGNGTGFIHDVGIVTDKKTKYYIGILTSDITDEAPAIQKAAEVSRIVYDFLK